MITMNDTIVVTAPTGGSAGVMPALVYVVGEGGRGLPQEKIRDGMLAVSGKLNPQPFGPPVLSVALVSTTVGTLE